MAIRDFKPIQFSQLCMIAKTLLMRQPTMDNFEWKARISETLAKMGFAEPDDLEMTQRAIVQVEYAIRRTMGPRPLPSMPTPEPVPAPLPLPKEGRTSQPLGWEVVTRLLAEIQKCSVSVPLSQPPDAHLLHLEEVDAVNEFWRQTQEPGSDRLTLLRAFAEIGIVRPADWDFGAVRAEARRHRLHAETCFVCHSDRVAHWHHIIQIQHGGSNYVRNRVALCESCHGHVHPWLPQVTRSGFCPIGEVAKVEMPKLLRNIQVVP
jgi:hypothetical protein